MESMKNLHKSLPGSTPRHKKKAPAPPEDLLQTFKAAALSVTNLYKRAAEELAAERQAGYQDAIYDLLSYLDKENIGLETGEGWRIRQWATERQDPGSSNQTISDEEEEREDEREDGIQALEEDNNQALDNYSEKDSTRSGAQDSRPPEASVRANGPAVLANPPRADTFTFHASHPYPEMDVETAATANQNTSPRHQTPYSRQAPASRISRRHPQASKYGSRQRQLGVGAGAKRKVQLNEFFDLGSLNFGKDPFGGGSKKPRPM